LFLAWAAGISLHGDIQADRNLKRVPSMSNPYSALPSFAFWRRAVGGIAAQEVDPVVDVPFRISKVDRVATAGSCFAQHISRTLLADGFRYLVTESGPLTAGAVSEGYGVFPARFANIYTVRQLLQLFERAYGLFEPQDSAWVRSDGAWIDPFRPRIQQQGFASPEEVTLDRSSHLLAVREMFEQCDIFVFTLGLTEAWVSTRDAAVFPLAPGVVASGYNEADYAFKNFEVADMTDDLKTFVDHLRRVNPNVLIVLTVSPVPLIATYEPRHVLVSTTYSKSALRVVADAITRACPGVTYFPSYEIITGPQARGQYYEPDLREIRPEGVKHVMSIFRRHFLAQNDAAPVSTRLPAVVHPRIGEGHQLRERMTEIEAVICDEEALDVPEMLGEQLQ